MQRRVIILLTPQAVGSLLEIKQQDSRKVLRLGLAPQNPIGTLHSRTRQLAYKESTIGVILLLGRATKCLSRARGRRELRVGNRRDITAKRRKEIKKER